MPKFEPEDYTQIPLDELCARLRGQYPSVAGGSKGGYRPGPLELEAARRLEHMANEFFKPNDAAELDRLRADITELREKRNDWANEAKRLRAENERLRKEHDDALDIAAENERLRLALWAITELDPGCEYEAIAIAKMALETGKEG